MNARAYIPVSLQPERGNVGDEHSREQRHLVSKLYSGATTMWWWCIQLVVDPYQSVAKSSSIRSYTQAQAVIGAGYVSLFVETPIGDSEPSARDNMGMGPLQ